MLGSAFLKRLSSDEDFELFAYGREELDIRDFNKCRDMIAHLSPDLVINCIAYTNVDAAENDKEEAMLVNAEAVGVLAELCAEVKAVLIHFSTDYVFDGSSQKSWNEDDATAPLNVYGESKLLGEKLIRERLDHYYIIRTSWLFGPNGKNFVDTMLKLAKEKDELAIVNDQFGSPTFTIDLIEAVLTQFIRPFVAGLEKHHPHDILSGTNVAEMLDFGIYHLSNSAFCSWFEFAEEILKDLDIELRPISSDQFARAAKRPTYSVLNNNKCKALRPWQEAVAAYLRTH